MASDSTKDTDSASDSDGDEFCPALPPHLLKPQSNNEPKVIGPTLPPGITENDLTQLANAADNDGYPGEFSDPMSIKNDLNLIKEQMERESLHSKETLLSKVEKSNVRESWMTELPEEKSKLAIFGLGTRKFMSKPGPEKGDCSVWTDTPEERERRKLMPKEEKKRSRSKSPDPNEEKMANLVDSYNASTRGAVPLVDMHSKKLKKEEPKVKERRAFSREEDMKVNKFNNAQRASILMKAQHLDHRFSKGSKRFL